MKGIDVLFGAITIGFVGAILIFYTISLYFTQLKQFEIHLEETNLLNIINTLELLKPSLLWTWQISLEQALLLSAETGLGCEIQDGNKIKKGYWYIGKPSVPSSSDIASALNTNNKIIRFDAGVLCLPQERNVANYIRRTLELYTRIPGSEFKKHEKCIEKAKTLGKKDATDYRCIYLVDSVYNGCEENSFIDWCVEGIAKCCKPVEKPKCNKALCKHYIKNAEHMMVVCEEGFDFKNAMNKVKNRLNKSQVVVYMPEGDDDCEEKYCFCISNNEVLTTGVEKNIILNNIMTSFISYAHSAWISYEGLKSKILTHVMMELSNAELQHKIQYDVFIKTRLKEVIKIGWEVVSNALKIKLTQKTFTNEFDALNFVKSNLKDVHTNLRGVLNTNILYTPDIFAKYALKENIIYSSDFCSTRGGVRAYHYGYDYPKRNAKVYAVYSGKVVHITEWGEGHAVWIKSNKKINGKCFVVSYGHIKPNVNIGDKVENGDVIGYITKDHLDVKHFWFPCDADKKPKIFVWWHCAFDTKKGYPEENNCGNINKRCSNVCKKCKTGITTRKSDFSLIEVKVELDKNVEFKVVRETNYDTLFMKYNANISIIEGKKVAKSSVIPEHYKALIEKYSKNLTCLPDSLDKISFLASIIKDESNWEKEHIDAKNMRYGLAGVPFSYAKKLCNINSPSQLLDEKINLECFSKIICTIYENVDVDEEEIECKGLLPKKFVEKAKKYRSTIQHVIENENFDDFTDSLALVFAIISQESAWKEDVKDGLMQVSGCKFKCSVEENIRRGIKLLKMLFENTADMESRLILVLFGYNRGIKAMKDAIENIKNGMYLYNAMVDACKKHYKSYGGCGGFDENACCGLPGMYKNKRHSGKCLGARYPECVIDYFNKWRACMNNKKLLISLYTYKSVLPLDVNIAYEDINTNSEYWIYALYITTNSYTDLNYVTSSVIESAFKFLGKCGYTHSSKDPCDPKKEDCKCTCATFVSSVFEQIGLRPPRGHGSEKCDIEKNPFMLPVDAKNLQPGDVFSIQYNQHLYRYGNTCKGDECYGHTGIYVGRGEIVDGKFLSNPNGKMIFIHSVDKGVVLEDIDSITNNNLISKEKFLNGYKVRFCRHKDVAQTKTIFIGDYEKETPYGFENVPLILKFKISDWIPVLKCNKNNFEKTFSIKGVKIYACRNKKIETTDNICDGKRHGNLYCIVKDRNNNLLNIAKVDEIPKLCKSNVCEVCSIEQSDRNEDCCEGYGIYIKQPVTFCSILINNQHITFCSGTGSTNIEQKYGLCGSIDAGIDEDQKNKFCEIFCNNKNAKCLSIDETIQKFGDNLSEKEKFHWKAFSQCYRRCDC